MKLNHKRINIFWEDDRHWIYWVQIRTKKVEVMVSKCYFCCNSRNRNMFWCDNRSNPWCPFNKVVSKFIEPSKGKNIKIEFNMVNKKAGDEAVNTDCLFLNLFRCNVIRLKIHRAFKGKSKSCKGKIIIDLDNWNEV